MASPIKAKITEIIQLRNKDGWRMLTTNTNQRDDDFTGFVFIYWERET